MSSIIKPTPSDLMSLIERSGGTLEGLIGHIIDLHLKGAGCIYCPFSDTCNSTIATRSCAAGLAEAIRRADDGQNEMKEESEA